MNIKKINIKETLICTLTVLFSWNFFIIFLYSANVKEVNLAESVSSFIVFTSCALLTILLGCIVYRRICAASVFSIILAVLLTNFSIILSLIQKSFPQIRYWHLLYVNVILAILLGFSAKQYPAQFLLVIKIVCAVYAGLIVINLASASPTIFRKINNKRLHPQTCSAGYKSANRL